MEIVVVMREEDSEMIDEIVCEDEMGKYAIKGYELENALNRAGFGIHKLEVVSHD